MRKNVFLIAICFALLAGMTFADFNENKNDYLSFESLKDIKLDFVGVIENKNTNKDSSKEKIDELYTELSQVNVFKNIMTRLDAFGIVGVTQENSLEKEVTREQLAKLMIRLLNMNKEDEEAEAARGLNLFTDINADSWACGYVNLAASKGILKGKDDGTFSPKESATYADIITALVKVLGYRDEFLPGSCPENFITKADDLGITKDVKYSLGDIVNRGDIYILIDNTLRASGIEKTKEDNGVSQYEEYEETYLKKKFGIEQYDEIKILEISKNVNIEGEINLVKFEFLTDMYKDKYKKGDVKIFKLSYDGNIEALQDFVAKKITIYMNDNNEVVYIEK